MIIKVGGTLYREHYVSFHVHRENIFSPWQVIGIYDCYYNDARCKYMFEYKYFEKEFHKECERAGNLCGTREFLENWRKQHIELNSVMTKVISYCTTMPGVQHMVEELCSTYLSATNPYKMAKIAIMLKSPKRFYPIVFDTSGLFTKQLEALRAANEI